MPLSKEQKELRRRWVEALRSGKYEQGRSWLHKQGRFCCLGVACEVMGVEWAGEEEDEDGYYYAMNLLDFPGHSSILPPELTQRLGISTDDHNALAELNDEGVPFCDIATLIENLPGPEEE